VLLEKSIPHEFITAPPRDPDSPINGVNPLAKIPALVLDDGDCIFDSTVIAEYADTLNDAPILIPRNDALARMRVRRWEALADGIAEAAVAVRYETARPPEKQDEETITRNNNTLTRSLAHAAAQLGDKPWCEGGTITLADLALTAALVYVNLRQPDRDWRETHGNLAAWFERMSGRENVRKSLEG
ncbi:MAG: glutathione S-transferase N-terminal domain-containing protein, partial [Gallionellaceae bacterium]|nr:glutathione S-transferase N-terminal domain-containing protein [Gallionellaceae bacterium]